MTESTWECDRVHMYREVSFRWLLMLNLARRFSRSLTHSATCKTTKNPLTQVAMYLSHATSQQYLVNGGLVDKVTAAPLLLFSWYLLPKMSLFLFEPFLEEKKCVWGGRRRRERGRGGGEGGVGGRGEKTIKIKRRGLVTFGYVQCRQ